MARLRIKAWGAIGVFIVMLLVTLTLNLPMPSSGNASMGGEYANIAESLVLGQGYADPFGPGSGPTAWMPPMLTVLIAGVFLVCGIKTYLALWVLLVLNCAAIAGSFYWLMRAGRGWLTERGMLYLGLTYAVLLLVQSPLFVENLTDFTYLLLLLALILHAVLQTPLQGWAKLRAHWITLAVLVPLSNASLCLCLWWGIGCVLLGQAHLRGNGRALSLAVLWRTLAESIRPIALILSVSALALGCWTVRNAVVFHKFIPLKSNLGFEAYLAQVTTYDGVLSNKIFLSSHPYAQGAMQDELFSKGEIAFVEGYKQKAFAAIEANPLDYLRRVGNRMVNAFIFTNPAQSAMATRHPFQIGDTLKLTRERLLYQVPPSMVTAWISLELPETVMKDKLTALELSDPDGVYNDWLGKRTEWKHRVYTPQMKLAGACMAGLPTLAMLLVLVRRRVSFPVLCAFSMVLLYLLPYIVISHYFRYQMPLIILHAVIVFAAISRRSFFAGKPEVDA